MSDITIRNATLADAPRILEIYAYYVEHTVITFEYDVPSLAEFEDPDAGHHAEVPVSRH